MKQIYKFFYRTADLSPQVKPVDALPGKQRYKEHKQEANEKNRNISKLQQFHKLHPESGWSFRFTKNKS